MLAHLAATHHYPCSGDTLNCDYDTSERLKSDCKGLGLECVLHSLGRVENKEKLAGMKSTGLPPRIVMQKLVAQSVQPEEVGASTCNCPRLLTIRAGEPEWGEWTIQTVPGFERKSNRHLSTSCGSTQEEVNYLLISWVKSRQLNGIILQTGVEFAPRWVSKPKPNQEQYRGSISRCLIGAGLDVALRRLGR